MTQTISPLPQPRLPGVGFEAVRVSNPSALRTDVALFIGHSERGPVGLPVRVDGMRYFQAVFGGWLADADCPLSLKGFFDNGGRQAWMLRLAPGANEADGLWALGGGGAFVPPGLAVSQLRIVAASPGDWANRIAVAPVLYRTRTGLLLDIEVTRDGVLVERLAGLPVTSVRSLAEAIEARSQLIRIDTEFAMVPAVSPGLGPTRQAWPAVALANGTNGTTPALADYVAALELAAQLPEPAMLIMPDLHRDGGSDAARAEVLLAAARMADGLLDRMVIADAPETVRDEVALEAWLALLQQDPAVHRCVACYHPWVQVADPLGDIRAPQRTLPPSGHVAGAIAASDLGKGAHVTAANLTLNEVIDTSRRLTPDSRLPIAQAGVNLLDCQSGRGMVIWGGRMLRSDDAAPRFVAHRRFIHRLVRALRRSWAPQVFEANDDQLRYAIARQATSLLLEAFHSGVLKGNRPDEAFRVDVGDTLNNAAARAEGRVYCQIAIAPAVPMEFIQIRISLSRDGVVEMVEP